MATYAPQLYSDAGKVYRYDANQTDPTLKTTQLSAAEAAAVTGGDINRIQTKTNFVAPDAAPPAPGATPPAGTNPGTTPVTRYTDAAASAFAQGGAMGDLKPYSAEEETAVREKARREVQAQIDAANELGNTELAAATQRGTDRLGQTRAAGAATGVIGSPTGDAQLSKTADVNSQEQRSIRAATAEKVAGILAGVTTRADSLIQARKADASKNAESYINYLKTQSDASLNDMKALATAQHTLSSTERQHLIDQTGYDPETFDALYKGIMVANTPKTDIVGDPVISGSKIIYTIRDAKSPNGLKQITLDAGINLEKGKYSISSDSNGVYILDQNTGKYTKVGEAPPKEGDPNSPQSIATKEKAKAESATNFGLVNNILNNSGLEAVTGWKIFDPSRLFPGTKGQLVGNQTKQLKAILSLDNRSKLKGSGAISDFESRTLADSASALGIDDNGRSNLGESQFKQQLKNVRGAFGLAAGQPQQVKITDPKTGVSKTGPVDSATANDAMLQGFTVEFQ